MSEVLKLPLKINPTILETYFSDPLEFEARYIYGLSKKAPYKRFVKKMKDVDDQHYDDSIFWHYQKQRVQDALQIQPLNKVITVPFGEHELTVRIDYIYDNTVVCLSPYGAPSQKSMRELESLQLILCGYAVEMHEHMILDRLEHWHLKGYKEIIEKTVYPKALMDEVIENLKTQIK